ncbi:MAG: carboxypeptidase regulatory-like domain-containing protein [Bacteroides sp.]|nr:carboxypeptidase regulatory-like domain-containing protein [Bacteroides sp.]
MKKILYITITLGICLLAVIGCKKKEEFPGAIYGIVTDKASGEPIRSAGVELQPLGTKTVTGSEGQFEFAKLNPGVYMLNVTKTGYEQAVSNDIIVKADHTTQSDVQLEKLPPSLKILDGAGKEVDTLNFGEAEADEARSFNIFNDGAETLQWQISKTAKWITSFSEEKGTLEAGGTQAIVVTIDRDLLEEKQNATTIQITSNNGSKELLVLAMNNRVAIGVNVAEATNVTATTAILHGEITNFGNPSITERGFVYTTETVATLENTIEKLTVAVTGDKEYSIQVRNLELGKTYNVRAYASNILGVVYSSNSVKVTPEATLPAVQTEPVSSINIANGTAIFNGNVFEEGDPAYTERGFAYGMVPNPTVDDTKKIVSGNGVGKYSANISDLLEGKVYYVRAYATNANGTAYGENMQFNLIAKMPVVSTHEVTNVNIAQGKATFNGFVDSLGDLGYSERGFVYAESHNPTIDDTKILSSGNGLGAFSVNVSNIEEGKMYYVRAYLTNTKGTVYGQEISLNFTAKMPEVSTSNVSNKNIASGTATFNGEITDLGDLPITERGFVYATVHNPSVDDGKLEVSGTGKGQYSSNVSNLEEGKVYYVRAYAINGKGIVYGNEVSEDFTAKMPEVETKAPTNRNVANGTVTFNGSITDIGDLPYTERGFVYAEVHNPTLDDTKVTASGSGTGAFSANASNMQEGKIYYIRAYAINSKGIVYGNEVNVDFTAKMPEVVTESPTNRNVANGTVTFNGIITDIGDLPCMERGFVYSDMHNPTLDDTKVAASGSSMGDFSANASDIQEGKVYYIRAYVMNRKGTVYGEEVTVDFNAIMPVVETKSPTDINRANGTATFNAAIVSIGDLPYTERGFVYAEVHNPTIENDTKIIAIGNGIGDFFVSAMNLVLGKVYYIRSYVVNKKGITYSGEIMLDFRAVYPQVITRATSSLGSYSVVCNATITNIGDPAYTERGFVYGTMPVPALDDPNAVSVIVSGNTVGDYLAKIIDLTARTQYYCRAYAKSNNTVTYGEIVPFKTPSDNYMVLEDDGIMVQTIDFCTQCYGRTNGLPLESTEGGFSDWRLPTIDELKILYNRKDQIPALEGIYWSSTYLSDYCFECSYYAGLNMTTGSITKNKVHQTRLSIRAVRAIQ